MSAPIAFVLKGYPRLSETFIAQEILALEQAGLDIQLVSLRHPTDKRRHPVHDEISAPVLYLPEYLYQEPLRVLRAWRHVHRLAGYAEAYRIWRADYERDRTPNRVRRFGQAMVLAHEMRDGVARLHSHFLHTPASVTRYASLMLALPWTCSAHAKDIWTSPDWELSEKLDSAQWTVVCTKYGRDHLAGLAAREGSVHLVYHGLDLERFSASPQARTARDGASPENAVQLITVGRAVEKKGLDVLLEALARLPPDCHWHWHHVGGGELMAPLKAQAEALELADRITWHGSQAQAYVLDLYRRSDVFVLPCRVAGDGDRDGLPNVLMEASSQALVCLSTPVSGVPELIADGETGLLVDPEDAGQLCDALALLIAQPALRQRLGANAQSKVRSEFDHDAGVTQLLDLFAGSDVALHSRKGAA